MQVLSLIMGILAIIGMFVGFFPCLGALNWLNIPFSMVGLIISIIALATAGKEESKGGSIAGIICCAIAMFFGLIRLIVGGGIV
jgi:hypothetical protein